MIQLSRTLVLISAGSALLVAGCSAPAATTPATQPAITASGTPVPTSPQTSPAASQTSPAASPSATACPSGEYRVTSFKATGKDGSLGNGKGGDISAEFENGRYEVDFDDDTPISLTLASGTGQLIIDGSIHGTYTGSGDDMTFTVGRVEGTAKTRYQGDTRAFSMKNISTVLGLSGKGSATCSGDDLTLKAGKTTFQMVRDD